MQLARGDMFTDFSGDFLLVTTNSYIKKDGSLVMGAGAAKTAAQLYPDLPLVFGNAISRWKEVHGHEDYGILFPRKYPMIGAFQVKYHFKDKALSHLIYNSAVALASIALSMPSHIFAVNFPGIGNGKLLRSDVLPIIEELPDNVYVYER